MSLYSLVPVTVAALLLLLSVRLLLKPGMVAAVLRAIAALLLLAASLALFLAGYDLNSYRTLLREQALLTVEFQELRPQHYRVALVQGDGSEQRYNLQGDEWQLDARILRWRSGLARVGMEPLYRLERLSGRYSNIQQQVRSLPTAVPLSEAPAGFDTWSLLKRAPGISEWLDAQYGSATFLPMADGARYEVALGYGGLLARPVNARAEEAVALWR